MKRRIAVLDLGTNTFHLLIADADGEKIIRQFATETRDVKLGEGGITQKIITEPAFNRGIEALSFFRSLIDKHRVDEIYAVATAALRTASNGGDFIRTAKEKTGIAIELIDGTREAELIYKGVMHAVSTDEPALIVDIGGGSVEFIFCDKHEVFYKKSYPIGAAKLMALFHRSDPISEADVLDIHQYLDEKLADLKINAHIFKPKILIGSAGAFETFADLAIKKFGLSSRVGLTYFYFNNGQISSVINELLHSTHAEREANNSIIPVRVDMIVVSSVLTAYVLEELQIQEVALSAYALKEGLLFDKLEQ